MKNYKTNVDRVKRVRFSRRGSPANVSNLATRWLIHGVSQTVFSLYKRVNERLSVEAVIRHRRLS